MQCYPTNYSFNSFILHDFCFMAFFNFVVFAGGKDSLVSWHIALTQGLEPVLLYVADGTYEYEGNWRLQKIVEAIGTDVHLGKD